MLSRFRSQLRLLTLSAVAVAAFAIPATAHAAVPECNSTSNFPIEGVDTYFYYDEITLAQAKADSEDASVTVTCSGDTAAPTLTIIPAQTEGAGTATVSAPVPGVNSNTWTITWNPDSAELAADRSVGNKFLYAVAEGGETSHAEVRFYAEPQYDTVTTLNVPASIAVAAAGTSTTISATLTNSGPDKAFRSFGFFLTNNVNVTSTSAGCVVDTTTFPPDLGVFCEEQPLEAGATRTIQLVLSHVPGTKGLTLPSMTRVVGSVSLQSSGGDLNEGNNSAVKEIALTAAAVSPVIVAPAGTAGNDTYAGTAGDDRYDGGAGDDSLTGGAGNDVLIGGLGNDKLFGGIGNDITNGGVGNDALYGEAGNDKLLGGAGNDRADGGAGNDIVVGEAGNDKVFGGIGNDAINGGTGNDVVYGQGGTDKVYCGSGKDVADGGTGNDALSCLDGTGGDTIRGGVGRDYCIGDRGDVFVSCERTIIRK